MFDDRRDAGRELGGMVASAVMNEARGVEIVVLALPRGGVPVGLEVAQKLGPRAALDVFLVRKLGVPGREELAFGAIATGGIRVLNQGIVDELGLSQKTVETVSEREQKELERRERAYREGRPVVELAGRLVILVDDGLATGASMIAAVRAVRMRNPKWIICAVPVASRQAFDDVRHVADEVICVRVADPFNAVGYWYCNFDQVTDDEVRDTLRRLVG